MKTTALLQKLARTFHLWRSCAMGELETEPEGFEHARAWLLRFLEALDADLAEERAAVAAAMEALKAAGDRAGSQSDGSTLAQQD